MTRLSYDLHTCMSTPSYTLTYVLGLMWCTPLVPLRERRVGNLSIQAQPSLYIGSRATYGDPLVFF